MNSKDLRREWADRSGEYSPAYYAYRGPDRRSERVRAAIDRHLTGEPAILEVGCSAGRHLAHLLEHGYGDLTGIELNERARGAMAETFPRLAARSTVHYDSMESVLPTVETDRFDAVFSVETLQHVHPDSEWVFDELARVTADLLITVENEGGGEDPPAFTEVRDGIRLYHRDWQAVFTDRGFEETAAEAGDRDTIRVFRRLPD
ncbi:MAG: class I SAM-dependent methyltransferase [Halodesulfurarchaeum sp.]